jgi:hypothetical protein
MALGFLNSPVRTSSHFFLLYVSCVPYSTHPPTEVCVGCSNFYTRRLTCHFSPVPSIHPHCTRLFFSLSRLSYPILSPGFSVITLPLIPTLANDCMCFYTPTQYSVVSHPDVRLSVCPSCLYRSFLFSILLTLHPGPGLGDYGVGRGSSHFPSPCVVKYMFFSSPASPLRCAARNESVLMLDPSHAPTHY